MNGALKIFLAHNPEDREVYYGRALAHLKALGEVSFNPLDRDLKTSEFIEAAKGCQIIVSHRSPPAEAALFDRCRNSWPISAARSTCARSTSRRPRATACCRQRRDFLHRRHRRDGAGPDAGGLP